MVSAFEAVGLKFHPHSYLQQDFSALDTPRSRSVKMVTCAICAWGDIVSISGQPVGDSNILE